MKSNRLIKDGILALLIVTNLFLAMQIWSDSNLFPDGAQSVGSRLQEYVINPVRQLFSKGQAGSFSQNIKNLMRPQRIILNHSNRRAVLYADNENYQLFARGTDELLEQLFTGERKVKASELIKAEDYYAVLKENSIYLDYDNLYDFRLFSVSVCGETKNALSSDFGTIRECIISLDDNVLNNIAIYMKDYKSGNIMRYIIEENKRYLEEELNAYFEENQSERTLNYSFELNFHKLESGDGTLTKLVFDPLILFNLISSEASSVEVDRAWLQNWSEMEFEQANGILSAFQINPMMMQKYTNLSNARVFVENDATLTLNPDGSLEYKTVEGGQGLLISQVKEKSSFDIYAAVSAAVDFVSSVTAELPGTAVSSLRFSSDLIESTAPGSYTITFDLYANGLPVLQTDPVSGEKCHCITMVLENGYLKHYRQLVRQYRPSEDTQNLTPVINAMDGLVDILNPQAQYLNILSVGRCYVDEGADGKLMPQWKIDVEGIDDILTVE